MMISPAANRRRVQSGVMLLEVLASLVIFSVVILPVWIMIQDSLHESYEIVVLRKARALAQLKMEEILNGIEVDQSGDFENSDGEPIEGFEWSMEVEPLDIWPNPEDVPSDAEDREFDNLSREEKDNLLTFLQITLTVTFPGFEDLKAKDKEGPGEGLKVYAIKLPNEDDIRDYDLEYR